MFGVFWNFRGFTLVGKAGKNVFEFTVGIAEEVSFNLTSIAAANAAEIPETINIKVVPTDQFITTTFAVGTSKIAQTKLFDTIAGATTNLFI